MLSSLSFFTTDIFFRYTPPMNYLFNSFCWQNYHFLCIVMTKIQAAIFDMDGLLIDSEPLWQEAEKRIFAEVGIELTTAMCEQTMGMRIDEVVGHWYKFKPWTNKDLKELEHEVVNEVEHLIRTKGEPMPGVDHIISFFKNKNLRLAVASSAHLRLIEQFLKN